MAARARCRTPLEVFEEVQYDLRWFENMMKIDIGLAALLVHLRNYINNRIRPQFEGSSSNNYSNVQSSIQAIGGYFGRIFLGTRTLEWVIFGWLPGLAARTGSHGVTYATNAGMIYIYLDPHPDRHSGGVVELWGSRTDVLLTILLHECLHALIRLLACDGKCGDEACKNTYREQVGRYDHGDAFMRLASLLERFVQKHGLWDCDMSLKMQARLDWLKQRARNPAEARPLMPETVAFCWPDETLRVEGDRLVWAKRDGDD